MVAAQIAAQSCDHFGWRPTLSQDGKYRDMRDLAPRKEEPNGLKSLQISLFQVTQAV
jgi:hypothetical protein